MKSMEKIKNENKETGSFFGEKKLEVLLNRVRMKIKYGTDLTIGEVAAYLSLSVSKVRNLLGLGKVFYEGRWLFSTKKLNFIRLGRSIRIPTKSFLLFLKETENEKDV